VTGGTTVRPGAGSDLPALSGIYNHFVEHAVATFDVEPFSVDARRDWFAHYDATGPHRLLVAEVDGRVVGYATSGPFRLKPAYARTVETTVYLERSLS
jgi:phosphinothricin acetyltransferase